MSRKTKSIVAIMMIIVTLSGIYFYWGLRMVKKSRDKRITQTIRQTNILIDEVIFNANSVYEIHLDSLLKNTDIIQAFRERNRKKLYQSALWFHLKLKNDHTYYSNMHFHLPSGHSFLRMHKPKEFGDDLRTLRPIIMQVHKRKEAVFGYEVGKHGLFYRVAKPVFYKDEYLGALELGIKAEEVASKIEWVLDVKVARVIADELLNDNFRAYCKDEIIAQGYSINPFHNASFFNGLIPQINLANISEFGESISPSNIYVFDSGKLKNYQNRTIAHFLIGQDMADIMNDYKDFSISSVYLTIILVVIAYVILQFSFGAYINHIIQLNKTLEARVKKRTRDLEQASDQLRTANAELYQIFNTAADGMRVIDRNFKIIRVNDTFANIMGREKKELEYQICHKDFQGEFCHSDQCTLTRILNGEEYLEINVDKEIRPGVRRSFLLTATPYKSADGEIIGVVENFKDVTERLKIFNRLKENERYLNSIMSTVQAGVIITDERSPQIYDANPYALKMMGCSKDKLQTASIRDYFNLEKPWIDQVANNENPFEKEDYILTTDQGDQLNIRLNVAHAYLNGKRCLVQSFSDITDVKTLIEKQIVDIHKAKSIMSIINPPVDDFVELPGNCRLFSQTISVPCNAEGGDHFFIHHFLDRSDPKTVISLKDQSGHEVNCILRSIYTDLLHNWLIFNQPALGLAQVMTQLNTHLCGNDFFAEDDFFTSLTMEIDHQSLELDYISAGHIPFLLIRDSRVLSIPGKDEEHAHLPIPFLPDSQYQASTLELKENDQVIIFTDGLNEMTMRHLGRILSNREIVDIVQGIIDQDIRENKRSIPVAQLMIELLGSVAAMSDETIRHDSDGGEMLNTSADDVTMIGVEVETMTTRFTETLTPECSSDISVFIRSFLSDLFEKEENQSFQHMKHRMSMILEETLINAWKHGNKKSLDKKITVNFHSHNDFVIQIMDQGDGFDFEDLPDPRTMENILKPSGRGLFIVRHFSDHVQWKDNGRHIIIILKKRGILDDRENNLDEISPIRLWQ